MITFANQGGIAVVYLCINMNVKQIESYLQRDDWDVLAFCKVKDNQRSFFLNFEDGKTYELFSYLLNNLIFSCFLKEEH